MKPNNRTPLCSSPFLTLAERPEGVSACCCRLTPAFDNHLTGEEWWNGEYLKDLRKKMFSYHTLPDYCKECMAGGLINSEAGYPTEFTKNYIYDTATGEMGIHPYFVLLYVGNKCNLACKTCNSNYSTGYAKLHGENRKVAMNSDPFMTIKRYKPNNWTVYGGEPFMYNRLYELFTEILAGSDTSIISILTNGTIDLSKNRVYNEIIKKHPKRFTFGFSVDADPEWNKYVREGTTDAMMEIIKSNIRLTMNDGIFTNIHATMSTLNMNRLYHFISWGFEEKFFNHPLTNFDINMVKLPRNLSPLFTPMPNIDEVDMMNKRIKQIYENSKNNLRPNMKKEIERAIMKIDKIVSVQKKKFGNRILTFIPDPKQ